MELCLSCINPLTWHRPVVLCDLDFEPISPGYLVEIYLMAHSVDLDQEDLGRPEAHFTYIN